MLNRRDSEVDLRPFSLATHLCDRCLCRHVAVAKFRVYGAAVSSHDGVLAPRPIFFLLLDDHVDVLQNVLTGRHRSGIDKVL